MNPFPISTESLQKGTLIRVGCQPDIGVDRMIKIGVDRMIKKSRIFIMLFLLIILSTFSGTAIISGTASGNVSNNTITRLETTYKHYSIYKYKNIHILCEPYIIKQGDWIYKIFRAKGELSKADFHLFLSIFKSVNPGINNMDRIEPGQSIIIPLKKVQPDDFKETVQGVVEVPVIKLSQFPERFDDFIESHLVRKGDMISNLLHASFVNRDKSITSKGAFAFKLVNPGFDSLDFILEGSTINLPRPSILEQPWFIPLMINSTSSGQGALAGNQQRSISSGQRTLAENKQFSSSFNFGVSAENQQIPASQVNTRAKFTEQNSQNFSLSTPLLFVYLKRLANLNHAKMMTQGQYYFPDNHGNDIVLDLQSTPLIRLKDRSRILFVPDKKAFSPLAEVISAFWQRLKIMEFDETREILRLNNVTAILSPNKENLGNPEGLGNPQNLGNTKNLESSENLEASPSKKSASINILKDDNSERKIWRLMTGDERLMDQASVGKKVYFPIKDIISNNHRHAVQKLLEITGYDYTPETEISIPMEGTLEITVKPGLIVRSGKPETLIFFGDIYGDALESLKQNNPGHVITMQPADSTLEIIEKLFSALDAAITRNPVFVYSGTGETITIPGIFIEHAGQEQDIFISENTTLIKEAFKYLSQKKIIMVVLSEAIAQTRRPGFTKSQI